MATKEAVKDAAAMEHYAEYDRLAKLLGINALRSVIPATREQIEKALAEGDEHLNSIPLPLWDVCHSYVFHLCGGTGLTSWSLCETVCVLKHVAQHYMGDQS